MYKFRGKCSKKVVASIMGAAVFLGVAFAGRQIVQAETVQGYDATEAVKYAKEHFDDGKTTIGNEDCTQFVRECLEAGGVPKDTNRKNAEGEYGYTVEDYKDYLLDNGYAQMYELATEEQDWETPQWYVRASDNEGKLSVGDAIVYLCNDCGKLFHASICNDVDEDGFAHYYAQKVAVDNMPLCKIDHAACAGDTRENITMYALHITSSENGYSAAYDNQAVSNLKVLRTGVTTLNITWDAVDGAKGYKVFRKNGVNSVLNLEADVMETSIPFEEPEKNANYYFSVRPYFEKDGKQYVGKLCDIVKNDEEEATTKLAAPGGVTAKVVNGKIEITWNKVAGADKYEVWRSTSNDGKYFYLNSVEYIKFTNSSVTAGTTYYYKVKAIDNENAEFSSDFSSPVAQTVGRLTKPAVKISLVSSSGKLKLTWNKVNGAGKYEIYRSTKSSSGFAKIGESTGTSFADNKGTVGTKYYYKVRAINTFNASANSDYSNVVYGTAKLAAPTIKVSADASTGKLKVTWSKSSGASNYILYRATSQKGKYKKLTTTKKTSYTDKKASVGKKYYYKVVAVHKKTAFNSAYSSIVSETCKLKKPSVKASTSSKKIKLTWKKISGASKYEVYRSTSKNGTYTKIATVKGKSYTNKSLKKGQTYYYKVRALHKKAAANSVYSNVVSKKCK